MFPTCCLSSSFKAWSPGRSVVTLIVFCRYTSQDFFSSQKIYVIRYEFHRVHRTAKAAASWRGFHAHITDIFISVIFFFNSTVCIRGFSLEPLFSKRCFTLKIQVTLRREYFRRSTTTSLSICVGDFVGFTTHFLRKILDSQRRIRL